MEIIRETLARLEVGPPKTFANLTLYPLLCVPGPLPDYATLDEAIEQGWVEVREVSASGSVPELTVANRGDRVLAPAGKTIVVPVSCVEQGRWASRSVGMSTSPDTLYARARVCKMAAVSRNYSELRRPMSDQGALWDEIAEKASLSGVRSVTGAMHDIFESERKGIRDYERAFEAVEGQCGAVFAIGDRMIGLELFEHPAMLRKMLPKIVRSYALDAIHAGRTDRVPGAGEVADLIREVAAGRIELFPAVGLGEDARIRGDRVTGAALLADDRVVHLCAFRTDDRAEGDPGGRRGARIASASLRRRR
jgi:hypothetical protein